MNKLNFKSIIVLCMIGMGYSVLQGCDSKEVRLERNRQFYVQQNRDTEELFQQEINKSPNLKGCILKVIRVENQGNLTVIRCPSSETTVQYKCGKFCNQNITTTE